MLPLIRDPSRLPNISVIYSGWSSIVFTITAFLLFSSKKYLKFGELEILPLYGFYVVSELIKWAFINSKFDLNPPYSVKVTSSGVSREIIKQIKNLKCYNMVKSSAVFIAGVLFHYILAIFFGAALWESYVQTFLFSLLMTILTVLPLCLHLGHESVVEFVEGFHPEDRFQWMLFRSVVMSWLGAWLGAFVIPLDWDRPWQEWPIPCSFGAIIALATYHFMSCVYHMGFYARTKLF